MGKPYSEDLRTRVVRAEEEGATIPEIAERLGVSISGQCQSGQIRRIQGVCSGGARGPGPAIGGRAAGYHAG